MHEYRRIVLGALFIVFLGCVIYGCILGCETIVKLSKTSQEQREKMDVGLGYTPSEEIKKSPRTEDNKVKDGTL